MSWNEGSKSEPTSVGLFLTNEHRSGADMVAALAAQVRFAEQAAEDGWDALVTGQHFISEGTQRLQPLPFLARLAAAAPGLRLATGIHLASLAQPVAMAEEFATVDVISGGRVTAGLGMGYRDVEFAAFGLERRNRVSRFERNLEIVRALWSDEPVTVDEPWCRLDGARIGTPPVQRPVPVWIGGTSTAAVVRAGRLADGWIVNPASAASALRAQAEAYRAAAAEYGRSSRVIAFREVFVAPTDALAEELAFPFLARKYQTYSSWGQESGHVSADRLDGDVQDIGRERFIVGSPQTVLRGLLDIRATLGVDEFALRTEWPGMPEDVARSSLDLLGREVLPGLR